MKVGIVLEDDNGIHGNVCAHFGQCRNFLIADVDEKSRKLIASRIVPNTGVHGGGGCLAVDAILKQGVTHVIAGGMGMGAQQKFADAGVQVFGYAGKVRQALDDLLAGKLGGLESCRQHGSC